MGAPPGHPRFPGGDDASYPIRELSLMGWVRLDDAFYDHAKFIAAGPAGVALWVTALAWSNRNLTDGFIPERQIARLLNFDGMSHETGGVEVLFVVGEDLTASEVATTLVQYEIFDQVRGGYMIHDYLDYQPSAEQITTKREKERTRWHRRAAGDAAAVRNSATDSTSSPEKLPTDSAATPRASQSQSLSIDKEPRHAPNGASARGSRIPETFDVTAEMVDWAGSNCPDVDWRLATKAFVAHWKAESGARATKLNWEQAWRKWLLKDQAGARRGAVRTHL